VVPISLIWTDFDLPQDTFFDYATIHLLTTATLDRLRELYPRGRFEVRRFRPNIVAETADLSRSRCDAAQPGEPGDRGESIVGAGPVRANRVDAGAANHVRNRSRSASDSSTSA
jgi:hypothetical protein